MQVIFHWMCSILPTSVVCAIQKLHPAPYLTYVLDIPISYSYQIQMQKMYICIYCFRSQFSGRFVQVQSCPFTKLNPTIWHSDLSNYFHHFDTSAAVPKCQSAQAHKLYNHTWSFLETELQRGLPVTTIQLRAEARVTIQEIRNFIF